MNELKTRKIHITIPEELHRMVRIRCAYEDRSIQDYVSSLIAQDMTQYDPMQEVPPPPNKVPLRRSQKAPQAERSRRGE